MIIITGSTGYLGRNITTNFTNSIGVSLRDKNWKKRIPQSYDVWINSIGSHNKKKLKDIQYTNIQLLKDQFNFFLNTKGKIFIHISSIAVIQELKSDVILDETSKCSPITDYGKTKLEAEKWLLQQNIPKDKKLIILRPAMIYGNNDSGNLNKIYNALSKRIFVTINGLDNQRSFTSIENLCFVIGRIMGNNQINSGVYNVVDDDPVSIKEILEIINKNNPPRFLKIKLSLFILKALASLGDFISLPINSITLNKLTGNLIVSNLKIKKILNIQEMPMSTKEGIYKAINQYRK